ncbi:TIGR03943 family protein [Jiangella aurantiaca]|uniref:TIGR03943 family protein n=1 Tax=Jiangella aurantiaca TaxID=2530373 RepID=A0A4V2YRL0_9ACTN|nr:TIGR03943 family protein [Jiangella aurantiaca]TDD66517.1 TIGR03943 family protein [Jiangella aurantiaca]
MDRRTESVLLLAVGAVGVRFGFSDAALAYLKPSFQPILLIAGVVLVLLGGHGLLRDSARPGSPGGGEHGDHDDHGGPGVAWLLAVPLLVLLLIAPPALGSFAAGRQGPVASVSDSGFVELPAAREGAVDLGLRDFVTRALQDPERSLDGVPVRVVGFVMPDESGDGYLLSRFTVACCAADATAYTTRVVGDGERPADTWVEVTGRWEPGDGDVPVLEADTVTVVPAPEEPYEY